MVEQVETLPPLLLEALDLLEPMAKQVEEEEVLEELEVVPISETAELVLQVLPFQEDLVEEAEAIVGLLALMGQLEALMEVPVEMQELTVSPP
jgi:hypothetical protein